MRRWSSSSIRLRKLVTRISFLVNQPTSATAAHRWTPRQCPPRQRLRSSRLLGQVNDSSTVDNRPRHVSNSDSAPFCGSSGIVARDPPTGWVPRSIPDTRPVGLGSCYPTLRRKEGEGWGTHSICGEGRLREAKAAPRSTPIAAAIFAQGRLSAPLKNASLGMTRRGGVVIQEPEGCCALQRASPTRQ